jgi:hypothetical protein
MEQFSAEDTFYINIPGVELLIKSDKEGEERRCTRGYASTEDLDQDREQVLQSGLDFSYLQKSGFLNYDHQKMIINGAEVPIIIGYPTVVEMRDRGLWVEGELLKADGTCPSEQLRLADEMWALGQALQKSGSNRRLAYSVEGGVLERRGKKIVRSVARHVAVTTKPVNSSCSIETFAKSLCCGKCSPHHPGYNPAHRCGNKHVEIEGDLPHLAKALEKAATTESHGALLKENLDRGLSTVLYGGKGCGCYDPENGRFFKGLAGAHDHLVKCMGRPSRESIGLLRTIIGGAGKSADLAALAKTAGLIRQ